MVIAIPRGQLDPSHLFFLPALPTILQVYILICKGN
jgi:hypothetical protein